MLPDKVTGKLFRQIATLKVNGFAWDDIAQKTQIPVEELEELQWNDKPQWLEYIEYAQQLADQETLARLSVGLQADFAKTDDPRLRVQISNSLLRIAQWHKPKATPQRATPSATPKKSTAKPLESVAALPPPDTPQTRSPSVVKTPLRIPLDSASESEPPPLTAEELAEIMATQEQLIRADNRKMMRSPADASQQLMQRNDPDPEGTFAAQRERIKLAPKMVLTKPASGFSTLLFIVTLVCSFLLTAVNAFASPAECDSTTMTLNRNASCEPRDLRTTPNRINADHVGLSPKVLDCHPHEVQNSRAPELWSYSRAGPSYGTNVQTNNDR